MTQSVDLWDDLLNWNTAPRKSLKVHALGLFAFWLTEREAKLADANHASLPKAIERIEHRLDDIDGRLSHIESDGLKDEVHSNTRRIGEIESALDVMKPTLERIERQVGVAVGTGKTLLVLLGGVLALLQVIAIVVSW